MWFFYVFAFVLALLAYSFDAPPWSFSNSSEWGQDYPECNGEYQSPIVLTYDTTHAYIPPLEIFLGDVPFSKELVIINTARYVDLTIPPTVFYYQPFIAGGLLNSSYVAYDLHFHWGSPNSTEGSEHIIKNVIYDMEMHIVHRNMRYETTAEALEHSDGLAVLAFMFQVQDKRPHGTFNVKLDQLFDAVAQIQNPGDNSTLVGEFTYEDFVRNFNLNNFYTYFGSLTTPPCAQAVQWHVFPDPLYITPKQMNNFYQLKDENGNPLVDNIRPVQPLNGRTVIFRI